MIFMINSATLQDQLVDVKKELFEFLKDVKATNSSTSASASQPLLVFANHQDLPNAMKPAQIATVLDLEAQLKELGFTWYLQACCGTTGEGVYEGMDWLSSALKASQAARYANTKPLHLPPGLILSQAERFLQNSLFLFFLRSRPPSSSDSIEFHPVWRSS